jgi:hypothetical protein
MSYQIECSRGPGGTMCKSCRSDLAYEREVGRVRKLNAAQGYRTSRPKYEGEPFTKRADDVSPAALSELRKAMTALATQTDELITLAAQWVNRPKPIPPNVAELMIKAAPKVVAEIQRDTDRLARKVNSPEGRFDLGMYQILKSASWRHNGHGLN